MLTPPPDRRTRKRLATRQRISDTASRLFVERGFDQVTVDQIAEAADVARMTVFNHFSRKEDMFFDLDEEGREDLLAALEKRDAGEPLPSKPYGCSLIGPSPNSALTSVSSKEEANDSWRRSEPAKRSRLAPGRYATN